MLNFKHGLVFAALPLFGCIRIETLVVQDDQPAAQVVFDADVPDAPASLPIYHLGAGQQPLARVACPWQRPIADQQGQGQPTEKRKARDDADRKHGIIECPIDVSRLERIEPKLPAPDALRSARKLALSLVSVDERSTIQAQPVRLVNHAVSIAGSGVVLRETKATLLVAPVRRTIASFPVDGPGSRALAVTDPDGSAVAYSVRWRQATQPSEQKAARDAAAVRVEIERQLASLNLSTAAHVQQIQLVYYDGDRELIQPAYRYLAEIRNDRRGIGHADHIVGFVPFAKTDEDLPSLQARKRDDAVGSPPPTGAPGQIKIGSYITRADHSGWTEDAHAFWDSIAANAADTPFVNSQFFYAMPEQFMEQSKSFVDSVDLALVEAHGEPWQFATFRTDASSAVTMFGSYIQTHGFGPGAGGRLRHLALHSCEVVPSPDDISVWDKPWRNIIKTGVHTVLGYRTSMLINDGAGAAFGERLARGQPVVFSWLTAVASLNAYGVSPSAHFLCDDDRPLGRPISIVACGASGAAITDNSEIKPDCLEAWWIGDELKSE